MLRLDIAQRGDLGQLLGDLSVGEILQGLDVAGAQNPLVTHRPGLEQPDAGIRDLNGRKNILGHL